jgi:hypothetical protein
VMVTYITSNKPFLIDLMATLYWFLPLSQTNINKNAHRAMIDMVYQLLELVLTKLGLCKKDSMLCK